MAGRTLETVTATALRTPGGKLLALVVFPMGLEAFADVLLAVAKAHPEALAEEAREYRITSAPRKRED